MKVWSRSTLTGKGPDHSNDDSAQVIFTMVGRVSASRETKSQQRVVKIDFLYSTCVCTVCATRTCSKLQETDEFATRLAKFLNWR